jgi:hypothetical protein
MKWVLFFTLTRTRPRHDGRSDEGRRGLGEGEYRTLLPSYRIHPLHLYCTLFRAFGVTVLRKNPRRLELFLLSRLPKRVALVLKANPV